MLWAEIENMGEMKAVGRTEYGKAQWKDFQRPFPSLRTKGGEEEGNRRGSSCAYAHSANL